MGAFALVLTGCERTADEASPKSEATASCMSDPKFRQDLAEARAERNGLAKARNDVVAKLNAMIAAKKAELKTDDVAKVRAELEKDPEWRSLCQRCLDANQAIEESRKRTLEQVRGRLTSAAPNNKISK